MIRILAELMILDGERKGICLALTTKQEFNVVCHANFQTITLSCKSLLLVIKSVAIIFDLAKSEF